MMKELGPPEVAAILHKYGILAENMQPCVSEIMVLIDKSCVYGEYRGVLLSINQLQFFAVEVDKKIR